MFGEMIWHIYGLVDPIDGKIRYIGMTKDPSKRLRRYKGWRGSNREMTDWLMYLGAKKLEPRMDILEKSGNYTKMKKRERYWIAKGFSEGWPLLNKRKVPRDDDWGDWPL
jgi:hypothetical protein